jgi:hypothetical protein
MPSAVGPKTISAMRTLERQEEYFLGPIVAC